MKLVVGLGNPGKEYENTRHNIGFMSLYHYLGTVNYSKKFNAEYYETNIDGEKYIFIKPLSYMNLSGKVVYDFVNFYKLDLSDVLVIQDDMDLEFGKIRIKINSSSGGHNGIKDIIKYLNSTSFARIKVGIAHNRNMDTKDYVLSKFSKEELNILSNSFSVVDKIIEDFSKLSIQELMSKYN